MRLSTFFTCDPSTRGYQVFDYLKDEFHARNYWLWKCAVAVWLNLERLDFDLASMRELNKKHTNPQRFTRNVWFTDKDDNQAPRCATQVKFSTTRHRNISVRVL